MTEDRVFGIFKAIVTDVSCFAKTGKIKTRISILNNYKIPKSLLDNYDKEQYKEDLVYDSMTSIMQPFGGGDNYGMFKLPPVNSLGLVTFIDGNLNNPIWIGGFTEVLYNNKNAVYSGIPTDNLDNNNGLIYYKNDKPEYNVTDESSFVLKTKSNTLNDDYSNPDAMDWTKNKIENAVVLNKNNMIIQHTINDSSKAELSFYNSEDDNTEHEAKLSYTMGDDRSKQIVFDDNDIIIKSKYNSFTTKIHMLDDNGGGEIKISSIEEDTNSGNSNVLESSITISPISVNIEAGNSKVEIKKNIDQSQEKITLIAPIVEISTNKLLMGKTGYSLVATPDENMGITLEDGTILTSAKGITV